MKTKLLLIFYSLGFGMFASLLILLFEIARYNYQPTMIIQFLFIGLLIGSIFFCFNIKDIKNNKILLIILLASILIIAGCNTKIKDIDIDLRFEYLKLSDSYCKGEPVKMYYNDPITEVLICEDKDKCQWICGSQVSLWTNRLL